jgi:DNA-binding GntR family transcriptional regulator
VASSDPTKWRLVYRDLKAAIEDGRLHAGERIDVSGLARQYEFGRRTVANAVTCLAEDGLVFYRPGAGWFVGRR